MIARTARNRTGWWTSTSLRDMIDDPPGSKDRCASSRGNQPLWVGQMLKFSAVGLLNTALDAALYLVLTSWLGLGGLKILAKAISYTAGIANSFYWNRSWTFGSSQGAASTFVPFALASLLALAINAGTMALGLRLFNQYQIPALAMATGVTLLWNFGTSKFLVFNGGHTP